MHFFILLYTFASFSFSEANYEADIKAMVATALQNSPVYQSEKLKFEIQLKNKQNSFWKMFPSLDFTSQVGTSDNIPGGNSGPNVQSQAGIILTANLYNNNNDYLNYKIASANYEIAALDFLEFKNKFVLDVVNVFFSLLQDSFSLDIERQKNEKLLKQYQKVEGEYMGGLKTQLDYLRFKSQKQRSDLNIITKEQSLKKTIYGLQALIGSETEIKIPKVDISYIEKQKAEQTNLFDIENHRQLMRSKLNLENAQLGVSLARRAYYPELLANGQAYSGYFDLIGPNAQAQKSANWSASLTLKFNLFDAGLRSRNIDIKKMQTDQIEQEIINSRLDLSKRKKSTEIDLQASMNNFKLTYELFQIELKSFDKVSQDYRRGDKTYLDYINGLNDFYSAQISLVNNYYENKKVVARIDYEKGILYDQFQ